MKDVMVKIQNLNKSYAGVNVLRNINLDIYQEEFIALVGQSGGGKSTLLRLIAGLEEMTSGEIEFGNQMPIIRVMFQDDRLLPWMTVIDNLSFQSKDPKIINRAEEMLNLVGLSNLEHHYPDQLSGGQRQRVALGRALMAKPQVLLLDEPLGALDALTRNQMQGLIANICEQQHLTAILVTHDVNEAAKLADRVLVVRDGNFNLAELGGRYQNDQEIEKISKKLFEDIVNTKQKGTLD